MNRAAKIWLIAAAVLVLAGILVAGGALAMGGWDFSAFNTSKLTTNKVEITEPFRNISVRSDTEDIVFAPSEDGKCSVVFYEHEKEKHTAEVKDGTLTIGTADTRKWFDRISFFSFGSPKTTVYLPENEYGSLFIKESTGEIDVPEDFTFENTDITASTGDMVFSASSPGRIRIKTDTGDISVENISAGELDLSVSTGKVTLSSVECRGNIGITVSTGKTFMTDVSCKSVVSGGSTGDIDMKNVIVSDTVTIERSTGDVKFERCDAGELLIKTDTGDVEGSLLSEKVFIVKSDTGRIDVPETVTGGKCKVTTDTGRIVITVE